MVILFCGIIGEYLSSQSLSRPSLLTINQTFSDLLDKHSSCSRAPHIKGQLCLASFYLYVLFWNNRQLFVPARTHSGAFLEQVITTTGYRICFKSLQMFPLENFHLWNCQVRCLWGETWLQGIGSCHDKSCRTKQQENFDFERKHLVWVVSVRWPLFPMQLALGRPRVDTRSWSRQILLVCTQCVCQWITPETCQRLYFMITV